MGEYPLEVPLTFEGHKVGTAVIGPNGGMVAGISPDTPAGYWLLNFLNQGALDHISVSLNSNER